MDSLSWRYYSPSSTPPTRAINQGGDGPPVRVPSLWMDGPCVKVIRALISPKSHSVFVCVQHANERLRHADVAFYQTRPRSAPGGLASALSVTYVDVELSVLLLPVGERRGDLIGVGLRREKPFGQTGVL